RVAGFIRLDEPVATGILGDGRQINAGRGARDTQEKNRHPSRSMHRTPLAANEPWTPKPSEPGRRPGRHQNSTSRFPAGFFTVTVDTLVSVTATTVSAPAGISISCGVYPAALNVSFTFPALRLTRTGPSDEPI